MGPSFIHRVVHRLSTGRNLSQIPVMQRSTWCGPIAASMTVAQQPQSIRIRGTIENVDGLNAAALS